MNTNKHIKIALADDHVLLRNSLAMLINSFDDCEVIFQASSGLELIEKMNSGKIPDILILDLNMPGMDGYETAQWLMNNHPDVKILMLTMYDTEMTLIRLLRYGVKGFLKKDVHPCDLKEAIYAIRDVGYYYSHDTTGKIFNHFRQSPCGEVPAHKVLLNETELCFLKYACTDQTYKEIAELLKFNPRSIDNLRDNLFTKLDVKSRVGLAIFALKSGIVFSN